MDHMASVQKAGALTVGELYSRFLEWSESSGCRLFLVGGTVRDMLRGVSPADIDVAVVGGDALESAGAFADFAGASFVPLGEEFQTARVVLDGKRIDFAAIRAETLHGDLAARDFTINAMALPLTDETVIIDPLGGRADLENRIIRMTGPEALSDDPLRLLRAFRFMATLGFEMEPETMQEVAARAASIGNVAGERVWYELKLIVEQQQSAAVIEAMAGCGGLLFQIMPELAPAVGAAQDKRHHHLDVWGHTMLAYRQLEKLLAEGCPLAGSCMDSAGLPTLKLAMLLHDSGKPAACKFADGGAITFHGHENIGAEMIYGIAERLRMSNAERDAVAFIIRNHMRIFHLMRSDAGQPTRTARIRFIREAGGMLYALALHGLADLRARGKPGEAEESAYLEFAGKLIELRENEVLPAMRRPRLIDGNDVMAVLGIPPSIVVGELLRDVETALIEKKITTRDEALEHIRLLAKNRHVISG